MLFSPRFPRRAFLCQITAGPEGRALFSTPKTFLALGVLWGMSLRGRGKISVDHFLGKHKRWPWGTENYNWVFGVEKSRLNFPESTLMGFWRECRGRFCFSF